MMKYSPSLLAVLLTASFSLLGSADAKETISITDKTSGKSIDVVIKSVDGGVVKFETPGGGSFELPASRLTPDSIERIKKHLSASQSTPAPVSAPVEGAGKINELVGHELFGSSSSIWQENAAEVAKRLSLRVESEKANSSSYRLYTKWIISF